MQMIEVPHKVIDYLCPINGVCDLYEWKTGSRIPDQLMASISFQIGFMYIKQKNAVIPRMVFWGNGIGNRQYSFLENVIGYKVSGSQGTSFKHALKRAKDYIDVGMPVILFGLNMYHLPYHEKYYHRISIPGHIILMIGYSDENNQVYIYDNSRAEVQSVPYNDLMLAWGEDYPGQSKKNALFAFQFDERVADVDEIIRNGLKRRAETVLHPPTQIFGIPGIRRLSSEFGLWEKDLGPKDLRAAYEHFVTFTGSVVPALPEKLSGFQSGIEDPHHGARDTFARTLIQYKDQHGDSSWEEAAVLFKKSGNLIGKINEIITNTLMGQGSEQSIVPDLLKTVADCEEKAFSILRG